MDRHGVERVYGVGDGVVSRRAMARRNPAKLQILRWGAPADRGAVAAYQVQRRKSGGSWEDVATSTDAVELLRDQPRGMELEFRVIALNRAGSGAPSATVTAVL